MKNILFMKLPTETTAFDELEILTHSAIQAWIVCFSAALFFFFEFMQVNMFNAITPGLMQSFHIQAVEISHLSAAYFYANVLFLTSAGMILDRVSTRKLLVFAMSLIVIATICFAHSTVLWELMICRLITGAGGAFALLSCVRLASRWFPPRRMALVVGLMVTFAMSGGMIAQTPFTIAVDHWGWRNALLLDAGMGAIILVLLITQVRDFPPGSTQQISHQHRELRELSLLQVINRVIRNRQNWLGGIYTSLMNLPIFLLGALWGSLYLVQVRHFTRVDASYVTSMLFVGTIVGSPLMGWLSDRIARRRLPMILGAVMALILSICLMMTATLSLSTLLILFFLMGLITSTQIISYPLIAESNPSFLVGSAEGLAATLIMAGGLLQTVFAILMSWHWDHQIINEIPLYSSRNYDHALMLIPIGFIIALLAAYTIRETYSKRSVTTTNNL